MGGKGRVYFLKGERFGFISWALIMSRLYAVSLLVLMGKVDLPILKAFFLTITTSSWFKGRGTGLPGLAFCLAFPFSSWAMGVLWK